MISLMVTGISGFIGGHVWAQIAGRDSVLGLYGTHGPLPLHPEKQAGVDFTHPELILDIVETYKPAAIIHLAAVASPKKCSRDALQAWKVNHVAVRELAEAAESIQARLIITSSDQVFSGARGYYREGDRTDPINVYGETKKAAERSLFAIHTSGVAVRLNNTYGPAKFLGSSFSEWILQRYSQGESIPLYKDQFRSPIDVVTASRVLIELVDHQFRGVLHLGGQERLSRLEFGETLLKILGKKTNKIDRLDCRYTAGSEKMPVDTSFDISLASRILQTPIPRLQEGIRLAYSEEK